MAILSENEIQHSERLIEAAPRILITTHIRPDGDAIGSAAAMRGALQNRYPEKTVDLLLLSVAPDSYRFLLQPPYFTVDITLPAAQVAEFVNGYALVIVVDTCSMKQLPVVGELLAGRPDSTLVIDHHLSRDTALSHCILADTQAAAAGQIVLTLLQKLNIPLTTAIAEGLFTAIATDTGWFRFENTKADCFRDAAVLMEAGIDIEKLYQTLFQNFPFARTKLVALALNSIELHAGGTVAVMTITNAMLEQTGAQRAHIENIVNECQNIDSVHTWVLLVETKDPQATRCSFRSRGCGVNVNDVARQFQGGGHARAAGATLSLPLAQAKQTVLQALLHAPAM